MQLKSERKPHLAVVGSADVELAMNLPHLPSPGETLFADPISGKPGGRAAHVSCALTKLGCRVFLFTCVGLDGFGAGILSDLNKKRINVDFVERTDQPTGIIHNFSDRAGNRFRVVAPGSGMNMTRNPLLAGKAMISSCQLLVLLADVSDDAFEFTIDIAHHYKVPVLMIPAPASRVKPDWLARADIVLAGAAELEIITRTRPTSLETAEESLNFLLRNGAGAAVAYLGRHGAACSLEINNTLFFPAPLNSAPLAPEAEEIFTASLAFSLSNGQPLEEACSFAVSSMNLVNSGLPDGGRYPTAEQVANGTRLSLPNEKRDMETPK